VGGDDRLPRRLAAAGADRRAGGGPRSRRYRRRLHDPRRGDLGDVVTLAGWSRELALNDWQKRTDGPNGGGRGQPDDRNVLLVSPVTVPVAARVSA
jgi:hypothetical protein